MVEIEKFEFSFRKVAVKFAAWYHCCDVDWDFEKLSKDTNQLSVSIIGEKGIQFSVLRYASLAYFHLKPFHLLRRAPSSPTSTRHTCILFWQNSTKQLTQEQKPLLHFSVKEKESVPHTFTGIHSHNRLWHNINIATALALATSTPVTEASCYIQCALY